MRKYLQNKSRHKIIERKRIKSKKTHKTRLKSWHERAYFTNPLTHKKARTPGDKVIAPKNFSFSENKDEIIDFLNKLKTISLKGNGVFINLSRIETLTNDAVVALISTISEFGKKSVQGNYPKSLSVRDKLEQSGFFNYVKGYISPRNRTGKTEIFTKFSNEVLSDKAASIVQLAMETVKGQKQNHDDVQRALVELMMNTFKHADPELEANENWWLSVEHDSSNKKVYFAFIDNGVGILKSFDYLAYKQGKRGIIKKLFDNNADILIDIFNGLIKSRTGLVFRGKGLPAILKGFKRNSYSKLTVITNDVYANFADSKFEKMNKEYSGTLIYFEISLSNTF